VVGGGRWSQDGSPPVKSKGKVPVGGLRDDPGRRSGGLRPPEAKAQCQISVQCLTFFWI